MLDIIRKASRTWVAKIFLVVLLIPFLVWGLVESIFSISGSSTIISVGSEKVPLENFIYYWKKELEALSQRIGFVVTSEKARAVELDKKIVENLVSVAVVDNFIKEMGVETSRSRVLDLIGRFPFFHGKDGKFSRDVFLSKLAQQNYDEGKYIDQSIRDRSRADIVPILAGGIQVSKLLQDQIVRFYYENRSVKYIVINGDDVAAVGDPSSAVITEWFEKRKDSYRFPEYKRLSYILFDVHQKAKQVQITEDDLRAEYNKRKDSYSSPETRTVEQLFFANKEEANNAFTSLQKGKNFQQLAKEQGKSLKDISLGSLSKQSIPDAALADAVFSVAKEDGYTNVVSGSFGYTIAHVSKIKPNFTPSFEKLKKEIEDQMRLVKASTIVQEEYKKAEKMFSSGKSMTEISQKENLPLVDLQFMDSLGKDKNGKEISSIPYKDHLLFSAFNKEQSSMDNKLALPDGSYMLIKETEVIPEREKKLNEIMPEVIKDWKYSKKAEKVADKAKQLVLEYNKKGKCFYSIGKPFGKSILTKRITRTSKGEEFFENGVSEIFSGPIGMVKSFPIKNGAEYVIFKVVDYKIDPVPNKDKLTDSIKATVSQDAFDSIISYLKSKYPVTIHEDIIDKYLNSEQ
ncbi:SurA N-terminal domain-containing protein [Candidatus Liberibacter africanus]|uniref:peptidylprolyl isomerase n=1 Tax=Liberibacter africanus TaxID=34020 RepID=UPI001AE99774|nr:peptidylprolyl isomerase [Candidatus Liberibacter africanus]QTP64232.1 SurA N-terminal domain-containing protein [Candidatus Liberibacter africanus]